MSLESTSESECDRKQNMHESWILLLLLSIFIYLFISHSAQNDISDLSVPI